jgi:uncharacterized protein YbaR (Trm112 family)
LNFAAKCTTLNSQLAATHSPTAVLAGEDRSMLRAEILATLCCPEDHSTLALADGALIREINTVIRRGRLRNRGGQIVEHTLDGGLMRAKGDVMYPILDGIPVLVKDEAIPLAQLGHKLDDE